MARISALCCASMQQRTKLCCFLFFGLTLDIIAFVFFGMAAIEFVHPFDAFRVNRLKIAESSATFLLNTT
jgi:hypothetical protein